MAATYPADTFREGVELTILASNKLHKVINGLSTESVQIEDGSYIPSLKKAFTDNILFKPPLNWTQGATETDFLQLRLFSDGGWYRSPYATPSSPVVMGSTPVGDPNWVVFDRGYAAAVDLVDNLNEAMTALDVVLLGSETATTTYSDQILPSVSKKINDTFDNEIVPLVSTTVQTIFDNYRTVSTSAPTGIPLDGEEWIVIPV